MRRFFIPIFIAIIIFIVLTMVLQFVFQEQTKNFGSAAGMLFLSIFPLVSYKYALKPNGSGIGAPVNHTKSYYEKRGELPKYEKFCKIFFFVFIGLALVHFIIALWNIFFAFLSVIFAK